MPHGPSQPTATSASNPDIVSESATHTSASYYVRVDIDDTPEGSAQDNSQLVETRDEQLDLTFVDLYTRLRTAYSPGPAQIEELTGAVQDHLHLCSRTDLVVFRWPWLLGPNDEPHIDEIDAWIRRLTGYDGGAPVLGPRIRIGVVQHQVSRPPIHRWGRWSPEEPEIEGVLHRLRSVETEALLRKRNAIWKPKRYHYRLPSGEHSEVFIRVADAINEPQDAYVMACWLSERLREHTGVVVDTGGLTPLIIQLESVLLQSDWAIGPTAILDAYPTGRPKIRQAIENAQHDTTRILAILSVSSTGTLQRTLMDELEQIAVDSDGISKLDYTLDIIVDRSDADSPTARFASKGSAEPSYWLSLHRDPPTQSSGTCSLCRHPEKAPLVAVDPRSYGEMALPGPHLVMPDIEHARAAQLFWERAAEHGGRAIEVNPHPSSRGARGKRTALPVRPIFEVICQPEGLRELVARQCAQYPPNDCLKRTSLVIAASHDVCEVDLPDVFGARKVDLKESLRAVLAGIGLDPSIPIVRFERESGNSGLTKKHPVAELSSQINSLDHNDAILIFSWGSVTGLTLREMKLSIADALQDAQRNLDVNGLVFHARLSHPKEASAQQNQFSPGVLESLWESCFPWASPIADERRLLDRFHTQDDSIPESARRFLTCRRQFLQMHATFAGENDDWSPRFGLSDNEAHPEHVFWGMSRADIHQRHVRGRSLYGRELDCLTAYAAIGSAINYTRFHEQPQAAPRWVMFDMGRVVRSYFDAVITCSVIRWLLPGELWWAERDEQVEIDASVQFLLDQAGNHSEQVLLVPELLLACAQGKVPKRAHNIVRERGEDLLAEWPSDERFGVARGAVQVGLRLMDDS